MKRQPKSKPTKPWMTPELHLKQMRALVATAEQYAAQMVLATITGTDSAAPDVDDVLNTLAQRTTSWNAKAFADADGDVLNSCFDAGMAWGRAIGLRLRGLP
jgi:hypothetical protein